MRIGGVMTQLADSDIEDIDSFRDRAQKWIVANLPTLREGTGPDVDTGSNVDQANRARSLQRTIYEGGFAGIRYPVEYGGLGLTREHQTIWRELTAGYEVPRLFKATHGILGPTLLEFGSEEQKSMHVPAMLRGEELWVQFLSEPSAGSDLASLLTQARREDDSYVVNGSKIWSSNADVADFAMILARTNLDVAKHAGLSMIIMPLNSSGLTLRPIQLATGVAEFCEEFFDDVRLPVKNLVGRENDGWNVVLRLFFHERNTVGENSLNDIRLGGIEVNTARVQDELIALAKATNRESDSHARQLIGEALVLDILTDPAIYRVNKQIESGLLPTPAASILTLMRTLTQYRFKEIAMQIGGGRAAMNGQDDEVGRHGHHWLVARIGTIAGGSSEMQRNAISERVLGLPRERAADAELPFREVLNRHGKS
jgi:alkylation response protein AidB-like acyl-CoA dehydrogenase